MAVLPAAKAGSGLFGPPEEFGLAGAPCAPAGTWVATVIAVCDQLGVEVPSYDNPQVLEKVDRTCFLFGFRDQAGTAHKVSSKWMNISSHPKAKLTEFLTQCTGKPFPVGQDFALPEAQGGMKGRKVLVTVAPVQRQDGSAYATLVGTSPVPAGFTQQAAPAPAAPSPVAPVAAAKVADEIPF